MPPMTEAQRRYLHRTQQNIAAAYALVGEVSMDVDLVGDLLLTDLYANLRADIEDVLEVAGRLCPGSNLLLTEPPIAPDDTEKVLIIPYTHDEAAALFADYRPIPGEE